MFVDAVIKDLHAGDVVPWISAVVARTKISDLSSAPVRRSYLIGEELMNFFV